MHNYKELIALRPVLYLTHQYSAGDSLPVNNPDMVNAWLKAGSAKWKEKKRASLPKSQKAVLVTAQPGQEGITSDGINGSLAGMIPETPERKLTSRRKRK